MSEVIRREPANCSESRSLSDRFGRRVRLTGRTRRSALPGRSPAPEGQRPVPAGRTHSHRTPSMRYAPDVSELFRASVAPPRRVAANLLSDSKIRQAPTSATRRRVFSPPPTPASSSPASSAPCSPAGTGRSETAALPRRGARRVLAVPCCHNEPAPIPCPARRQCSLA
jgi:hypothetical protein